MSQNGKVTKPSLKGQCQEMEFETLCECLVSVKTCAKLLSWDLKGLFEDRRSKILFSDLFKTVVR